MKTFALAGNPNSGKTTLFNALTGSTAHVGNWPGVTVDKREGVYKKGSEPIAIVDLPGIYSLSPYTPEEVISRTYILEEKTGIINIVDATNLERNLYLTTQLLETDVPVIVALNMMDEVEKAGDRIDVAALEKSLGVPVVEISALKEKGIAELMKRASLMATERKGTSLFTGALKEKIDKAAEHFAEEGVASPLFHAVKLLENDELEIEKKGAKELLAAVSEGEDLEAAMADARYKYIAEHFSVAKEKAKKSEALTKSDKIDKVLTHRVWAIPIFIAVLFAIFHVTFAEDFLYIGAWASLGKGLPSLDELNLSEGMATFVGIFYDGAVFSPGVILFNIFDVLFGKITEAVGGAIATEWLSGLIADGILGGLFAVLGFLPQILMLFMWFSILEDSGYMARIAFVLDRIFRRFGLSGRSFMPMIMGFGCSVPAMINTRTLADEKERVATVRVIPFFSCGAKLPILTAIAGCIVQHFGVGNPDAITLCMYLLGMAAAIVSVLLMRSTTLKGEVPPFIMELPAYHRPRFKNLMLHLWDKTKHFVKKAFTIIFVSTVAIWLLSHLSFDWHYLADERMNESILAQIGKLIQPIFTPLGFGKQIGAYGWVFAVAAITGLIAKENVIATFGTLGACLIAIGANVGGVTADTLLADEEGITSAIAMVQATGITIPALLAFIAFNMTTIPCFAAVATAKAELGKGRFVGTLVFWLVASYIIAAVVYTIGSWWWTAFIWAAVAAVTVTLIVLRNKGKLHLRKKGACHEAA
ncbi:MAG: ferrous iron transporter B [Clostridiales bacterium]|nr:ferrous iron transporter B [Clostridiales bacterium]